MLPPQGRRPLRARRRHPLRGRRRPFPCPPQPPGVASPRLGQLLRRPLDRGRIDDEALRKLLACHPIASTEGEKPVYAVDASVWDRCDAETSPQRGYYYHPSRHSAGQPIVAGWAYQFIAQLGFARESWTAPVDVERVRPAQDANVVATEQVEALLGRLEEGVVPCSSSTRATTLSSSSEGSRGVRARSSFACERGGASTATRASRIRPHTSDALVATGRR
jgi:DDE superfamily endonuclease